MKQKCKTVPTCLAADNLNSTGITLEQSSQPNT